MVCKKCTRSKSQSIQFVPKSYKKGVLCKDCYNDTQRIANRKSRANKDKKDDIEIQAKYVDDLNSFLAKMLHGF